MTTLMAGTSLISACRTHGHDAAVRDRIGKILEVGKILSGYRHQ